MQEKSRISPAKAITTAAALILAGVLLFYSLRGINWRLAGTEILGARVSLLGLTALIFSTSLFGRSYRWRVLLHSEAPVSIPTAFWATCAGYFGNNFLPARAGELIRTYMISTHARISKAFVLTTALSERVADAITVIFISAVVLMVVPEQPGWFAHAAIPFAAVAIGGILVISAAPRLEWLWTWMIGHAPVSESIQAKLTYLITHGLRGIRSFHDTRRLSAFILLTMIIWSTDAVGAIMCARAMHFDLSMPVAFLLIAGLALGSALPSTPGYVGIYQFVAVSILVPFGFSKTHAIAYIIVMQALTYVVIGCFGAIGLWRYRTAPKTAAEPI